MSGTAPAWQVREMQRQALMQEIHRLVLQAEEEVDQATLYRVLLRQLERTLASKGPLLGSHDMLENSWEAREKGLGIFEEIRSKISHFRKTTVEEQALLADIFVWMAQEIARPHKAVLASQELHEPEKIYGVKDRIQDVPFD